MPTSVMVWKRTLTAGVIVSLRFLAPPFPYPTEVSFYYKGGEDA
jgi:hypothetical protein